MAVHVDPNAIVQTIEISNSTLQFKTPMIMCISGSTMSGKTEFILKLIVNRKKMFDTDFEELIYCSPETLSLRHDPIFQSITAACPNAKFISGLPNIEKLHLNLDIRPKLLILDDLQEPLLNDPNMLSLMTAHCHHFNITLIFTLQNFFSHSKFGRTLFRQINYRVIFYNRLDLTEIRAISNQLCQSTKFLIESFEFLRQEFPSEPCYILIDGHMQSPLKELYVRSKIFPENVDGEAKPIFFFPK